MGKGKRKECVITARLITVRVSTEKSSWQVLSSSSSTSFFLLFLCLYFFLCFSLNNVSRKGKVFVGFSIW